MQSESVFAHPSSWKYQPNWNEQQPQQNPGFSAASINNASHTGPQKYVLTNASGVDDAAEPGRSNRVDNISGRVVESNNSDALQDSIVWSKPVHTEITKSAIERLINDHGMKGMLEIHLEFINEGNLSVDIENPASDFLNPDFEENQKRHFNRNKDGTDSREEWAEHYLKQATMMWKAADDDFRAGKITEEQRADFRKYALRLLGRGLHSVQDIEAHGNIGVGSSFFAAHGPDFISGVDDPHYDWIDEDRRRVKISLDQERYTTSVNDSWEYIYSFYVAIGLIKERRDWSSTNLTVM
jgi:hypothetical protein